MLEGKMFLKICWKEMNQLALRGPLDLINSAQHAYYLGLNDSSKVLSKGRADPI